MTEPNRETYAGDSRYKAKRHQGYDMQRNFVPQPFDKTPGPISINTQVYEKSGPGIIVGGPMGTAGYNGEASVDPLADHLKGIRDESYQHA